MCDVMPLIAQCIKLKRYFSLRVHCYIDLLIIISYNMCVFPLWKALLPTETLKKVGIFVDKYSSLILRFIFSNVIWYFQDSWNRLKLILTWICEIKTTMQQWWLECGRDWRCVNFSFSLALSLCRNHDAIFIRKREILQSSW